MVCKGCGMAKVRGYSSYHGRGPMWKTVAAVLLIATILASFGVLALGRYIVVDDAGLPRIQLPWADESKSPDGNGADSAGQNNQDTQNGQNQDGGESGENNADGENAEAIEPQAPVRELLRTFGSYTKPFDWDNYNEEISMAERYGYTAFSVLLKDGEGTVYFKSDATIPGQTRARESTNEVLKTLAQSQFYSVARLTCFLDSQGANSNVRRYGLRNTGTYLFYDGNAANWMDPSKPDARAYLCDLARDAAELGFQEILLTHVGYPTEGKLDKIAYGDTPISENLSLFLSEMREALNPYGVKLSVQMPRAVFTHEENPSGLTLDIAAPYVDRMYCVVTPEEIDYCDGTVFNLRDGAIEFVPILSDPLPQPLPRQFLYLS